MTLYLVFLALYFLIGFVYTIHAGVRTSDDQDDSLGIVVLVAVVCICLWPLVMLAPPPEA